MRRVFITAAVAVFMTTAPAWAWATDTKPASSHNTSQSHATSKSNAKAHSASHSKSQSASRSTAQSGSVNGSVSSGDTRVLVVPGLAGLASGACTGVSTTASAGAFWAALGFGRSEIDDDCTLRNNIATVVQFDPTLAREMVNDLTGVRAARARLDERASGSSTAPNSPIASRRPEGPSGPSVASYDTGRWQGGQ